MIRELEISKKGAAQLDGLSRNFAQSFEFQTLSLLKEENRILKKELDDCFDALGEKETVIQSNKYEVL